MPRRDRAKLARWSATAAYVTLEGYAVEGGFDRGRTRRPAFAQRSRSADTPDPVTPTNCGVLREVLDLVPVAGLRRRAPQPRMGPARAAPTARSTRRRSSATLEVATVRAARSGCRSPSSSSTRSGPRGWVSEAWLLPWVVPHVIDHARRVVDAVPAAAAWSSFTQPLSRGQWISRGQCPPWRRGARRGRGLCARADRAGSSRRFAPTTSSVPRSWRRDHEPRRRRRRSRRAARFTDVEELYVRSLVRGSGPTRAARAARSARRRLADERARGATRRPALNRVVWTIVLPRCCLASRVAFGRSGVRR